MKEQILENICNLYRSHIITAIIFLVLILLAISVTFGVIKFDIIKSSFSKSVLVGIVIICSILLVISQFFTVMPIYNDYRDSSYVIIDKATVVIKGDSYGIFDRSSTVSVKIKEKESELKMQTDLKLDVGVEYVGTVAVLKHSKYIVWYDFEKNTGDG